MSQWRKCDWDKHLGRRRFITIIGGEYWLGGWGELMYWDKEAHQYYHHKRSTSVEGLVKAKRWNEFWRWRPSPRLTNWICQTLHYQKSHAISRCCLAILSRKQLLDVWCAPRIGWKLQDSVRACVAIDWFLAFISKQLHGTEHMESVARWKDGIPRIWSGHSPDRWCGRKSRRTPHQDKSEFIYGNIGFIYQAPVMNWLYYPVEKVLEQQMS